MSLERKKSAPQGEANYIRNVLSTGGSLTEEEKGHRKPVKE